MNIPEDIRITFEEIKKKRGGIPKLQGNIKRLDNICKHVTLKWRDTRPPYPYTPHDHTHNIRVEEVLYKLFPPEELNERLSTEDIFLLLASVWLHDIGMIPKLFPEDKEPRGKDETIKWDKKVRNEHERRTERYIRENREILELTDEEANALIEICRYHRYKKYKELQEFAKENWEWDISGIPIHIPLLTACLRLADALHIPRRADVREFKIYMALGLDVISKIHWLKSKYAWKISPIRDMFKISIVLKKPPGYPDERMEPLRRTIEVELQDEVDAVREILIKGGLPVYLTVECECSEFRMMNHRDAEELEELLTDIELFDPTMSPNATSVIDIVLKQITLILDPIDKCGSISLLNDYKTNVLDVIVKDRPCHVFLWKVKDLLDKNISNSNKLTEQECNEIFEKIQHAISVWRKKGRYAMEKLPEMAYPVLAGGFPILLYGYSSSIAECLKYLVERHPNMKETLKVYVCQGVTKNRYRYNNRLIYCDGIKYIKELKERTEIKNISYITDSCASNLFSKGEVKKVFFGANGIDRSGHVAHTLGHLAIADMAKTYGIPVYVIADSLKIGDYYRDPNLQRGNQWLTTDVRFEPEIENYENYNPREDIVPPDRIEAIITEKGIAKPREIGDYAEN